MVNALADLPVISCLENLLMIEDMFPSANFMKLFFFVVNVNEKQIVGSFQINMFLTGREI